MTDPLAQRADDEEPAQPTPHPDCRLVEGTVEIDDLDEFLAFIEEVGEETDAVVQAFDADYVVDGDHLRRATRLAARAIARDEAVARDPAVEVLLYAAGRRQIDRGLELGVSSGENRVVLVVADFGGVPGSDRSTGDLDAAERRLAAGLTPEATLGTFDEVAVREYYDVSDRELAATAGDLADVVHERVALLDVEK
ncbi:KEOPS complex subunit Cgi121 [Halorubrum alkaliphilum]|uniref:KEOPS complex subunit Cgi121 n=1 Tax=Halorubrum alkaliphilum TaxID=261290 RepID=A0A8T4GHW5_9EURY|nr:KEOPS complex subunit Cgi121 [Halorubrum alkaliphilum]MBP1922625.1 KEOPS complex subunit Cgi121 [Halorubrum alkaliphilum]